MNRIVCSLFCAAFAWSGVASAAPIVFSFTGAIQNFTITTTGNYLITALGASGASATGNFGDPESYRGGRGGKIQDAFSLVAGDTLSILVGGQGNNISTGSGGGGGGSFVALGGVPASASPLLVAGGGGGGGINGNQTSPDGGALGGSGGGGSSSGYMDLFGTIIGAGGGGGFYGDGLSLPTAAGGQAFVNGGAAVGNGGFGGGGSTGTNFLDPGAGGGGYNGGRAGLALPGGGSFGGFGGTSFSANASVASAYFFNQVGFNEGNGLITFELLEAPPEGAPAPGALAVMMLGLIGLGALRRRATV